MTYWAHVFDILWHIAYGMAFIAGVAVAFLLAYCVFSWPFVVGDKVYAHYRYTRQYTYARASRRQMFTTIGCYLVDVVVVAMVIAALKP